MLVGKLYSNGGDCVLKGAFYVSQQKIGLAYPRVARQDYCSLSLEVGLTFIEMVVVFCGGQRALAYAFDHGVGRGAGFAVLACLGSGGLLRAVHPELPVLLHSNLNYSIKHESI